MLLQAILLSITLDLDLDLDLTIGLAGYFSEALQNLFWYRSSMICTLWAQLNLDHFAGQNRPVARGGSHPQIFLKVQFQPQNGIFVGGLRGVVQKSPLLEFCTPQD